jgi:hypothetical protein
MANVGYLMGHNHVVLGIHRSLNIVANDSGPPAAGGHGAGVGVGERNLPIRGPLQPPSNLPELAHLRFDSRNLVLQMADPSLG